MFLFWYILFLKLLTTHIICIMAEIRIGRLFRSDKVVLHRKNIKISSLRLNNNMKDTRRGRNKLFSFWLVIWSGVNS